MNLNPLTTNRAEAAVIIRAALEAGTLPAQHGLAPSYYGTAEDGTVCRCAIGALFPESDAALLQNGETDYLMASGLMQRRVLIVPAEEREWFVDVQTAHDDWANASRPNGPSQENIDYARATFLELLR